ncbi:hypothetical protein LCGC14_3163430, partial [marine sediment metagenome]
MARLETTYSGFFDPVKEFVEAKNGYERKRGSSGAYPTYPNTTWDEVGVFYNILNNYLDAVK